MAFVEVICKNCGGKIILDDKLKSGVCEYCKTTFVREEQNITNHFHNNTTVVYNTDSTIEEKLKSADVHLNKLNNYENAKEIYEYVIKNKADDYRGWWGMALVLSRKLTYIECDADRFAEIKGYAENAMKVADGEHKKEISALWNDYSRKFEEHKEKERIERQEKENIRLALEKKQKKSRAIRKSIGIALSLICNIGLLIWYFSMEDISELNENDYIFRYGPEDGCLTELGHVDGALINPEKVGCMVGEMLGVFASGNGTASENCASFDWAEYQDY